MAKFSDVELEPAVLEGLRQGDHAAFGHVYAGLSPTVMGMAVRILQDEGLAQEVVQETFVKLYEQIDAISELQAVAGWVRRVAVNECLMRLRSPWHSRREALGDDESGTAPAAPDNGFDEVAGDVEKALGRLGGPARMVVWLHDVEGYTHAEIGRLMGKTTSYSKSQLARAYEKLLSWRQAEAASARDVPDSGAGTSRRGGAQGHSGTAGSLTETSTEISVEISGEVNERKDNGLRPACTP